MTYKENFVKDGEDKTFTNPFLALLVNERKVKVFWKEKWYDFIIKQCAEDSTSKKITYTCKDLYVNELSIFPYPPYSSYLLLNFVCFDRYMLIVISSNVFFCSTLMISFAIEKYTLQALFVISSSFKEVSLTKSGFL